MESTRKRLHKIVLATAFGISLISNSTAYGAPAAELGTTPGADNPQTPAINPPSSAPTLIAQGSDPSPYVNQLENNTKAILLKIIELERYTLKYRSTVAKQGRWKGWRYLLTQETNNSVSMAGFIVGAYERCRVWHYKDQTSVKKHLNRNVLEAGNVCGFVAQIIGASGSAVEFGINGWHEVETHRKGFSPAAARAKVKGICSDIQNLLAEREKIEMTMNANCGPTKYAAVSHAEEPVLEDMRDISLGEFKQFHSSARRLYAFQQTLYLTDVARNVLGAFGNRFGWDALRTGDRHNNTRAGVFFVLSGGLTILNPISSRAVGKVVGEYHKHYIKTCTAGSKGADVEKLNADIANLTKIATSPELQNMDLPVLRTALYSEHEDGCRKQVALASRELRAGVLTASENLISGTLIGGAKTAGGIMFLICGSRFPHNGRITNYYLGTGNIIGLSWTPYAILETLRIQVKREFDLHRLRKKGETPGQIIKARLAKLDALEDHLLHKNYPGGTTPTSMDMFNQNSLPVISQVMDSTPPFPDFSEVENSMDVSGKTLAIVPSESMRDEQGQSQTNEGRLAAKATALGSEPSALEHQEVNSVASQSVNEADADTSDAKTQSAINPEQFSTNSMNSESTDSKPQQTDSKSQQADSKSELPASSVNSGMGSAL